MDKNEIWWKWVWLTFKTFGGVRGEENHFEKETLR